MRINLNKTTGPAAPFEQVKRTGSNEYLFNGAGELNASSKRDALQAIAGLLDMVSKDEATSKTQEQIVAAQKARQIMATAYADRSPNSRFAELGETVADALQTHVTREGFMRRVIARQEVSGNVAIHRAQVKEVVAVVSRGTPQVYPQYLRGGRTIIAQEFAIVANIFFSKLGVIQAGDGIYEEKFNEALEAIMVAEDRHLKTLLDACVGPYPGNALNYVSGGLTPSHIASFGQYLIEIGSGASGTILMAADYTTDMIASAAFSNYYDPVTKLTAIRDGRIMNIFGREVITDGYRHPNLRVLNPGEMYFLAPPEMVGAYTDRGPVESTEVNGAPDQRTGRGWAFEEILSMAIHNPSGVVKAQRA